MLLGVIADDFTGASDIANALAKGLPGHGGLRTTQYLGIPAAPAAPDVEAGVVSLKSRSIAAGDAVDMSLRALRWLEAQGCRQFVFKYCSTFDSTPAGNIGPVGEALADALGVKGVVACPAFPALGRSVYQGHLFVKDRPLHESGLENHPLTPMTDPDIRRWLRPQCAAPVGLVPWPVVDAGASALRAELDEAAKRGETLVIVDALRDRDLISIGRACRDARLLTGGSGIALALPGNFRDAGLAGDSPVPIVAGGGPEAILVGSCSVATRQQVALHAEAGHPVLGFDVRGALNGTVAPADLVDFISTHAGKGPLVYSSGSPEQVAAVQRDHGRERVSAVLDRLFAETARALVSGGIRRLVIAGGETSGAVVSALGFDALTIGPEIDPGVPMVSTDGAAPLVLALKSGNFGAPDFFAKALRALAGNG